VRDLGINSIAPVVKETLVIPSRSEPVGGAIVLLVTGTSAQELVEQSEVHERRLD